MNPFDRDDSDYVVLVNDEGQHSLWPAEFAVPLGWTPVGPQGKRRTCLEWIDEAWQDIRPKSLIAAMEQVDATVEHD
jgi:MbtH protein